MNKWLYRAAGAVGVASGTLLLSSGVAHAGATPSVDPEAMRAGVADFFTPAGGREEFIGGLLGGGGGSPLGGLTGGLTGGLGGLTGGTGGNSLLSGLTGGGDLLGSVTGGITGGASPIGDLTGGLGGLTSEGPLSSLTGGLTDDGGPLKTVTSGLTSGDGAVGAVTSRLTGKLLGGGGDKPLGLDPGLGGFLTQAPLGAATEGPPSTDLIDPELRGTSIDTSDQRAIQLDPDTARQVNDAAAPMVSALIADAVAKHMGMASDVALSAPALPLGPADQDQQVQADQQEEGFPLVNELPVVGALLGGEGPLGKLVAIGDLHKGIPLVGPALDGQFSVDSVNKLPVVGSLLNNGLLKTSDGPGLPLVGSLPFVGGALNNLGTQSPIPAVLPPAARPPMQTLPAPAGQAQQAPHAQAPLATPGRLATTGNLLGPAGNLLAPPAGNRAAANTQGPIHVGKHRATERPEITDPDYLESGSTESGATEAGTLPLIGSLTGGDLPLVGPLLKQLPLVGGLL